MRRTSANLLLLLAGAVWGMGFVAQSEAMASVGPMLFLGLRFLLAAAVTAPFAVRESRRAERPVSPRMMGGFAACGAALFVGMAVQQVGLLTTTVTNSGFLTGLYVVFTPLLALAWTRRAPHPVVWPAALSALAGIWLLSGGAVVSFRAGDLLTILCALVFSVQVTLVGIYAPASGRPLALSLVQFSLCAALGLLGAVLAEPIEWQAIAGALPEILYAGIFASGLAFSLQVIGQRYTSAPQAAILLSTEALFAAVFGVLLLGEDLGGWRLLGCVFIFASVVAVEVVPALKSRRNVPVPAAEEGATGNLSHFTELADPILLSETWRGE